MSSGPEPTKLAQPAPAPAQLDAPAKLLSSVRAAIEWRAAQAAAGRRVVFANGCFDLLHGGHVSYLEDARARGDMLIVGVNSDASERGLKGPGRPIVKELERLILLDAIRHVDALVLFDELTCENLLRALRPDVHAKGTDYTADTIPEKAVAAELGIEVAICGPPKENASRGIVQTVWDRLGPR